MDKPKVIKAISTVERVFEKSEGYSSNGDAWMHPEVEEEYEFDNKAKQLIAQLVSKELPEVGNFYADSDLRQHNLQIYFNALFWAKPTWMLIGEAPGIHGCAKTGIPFTSERLIADGGMKRHFSGTRFKVDGNKAESSATRIWSEVNRLSKPPIMWNAFPLHPMDATGKNRTPRASELEWGRKILTQVLELFPGVKIVSVGRKAEEACYKLGAKTEGHLFHPARHTKQFREQFNSLFFQENNLSKTEEIQ